MSVLVWRLQRAQAAIAAVLLAGFAAVLVVTGLSMASQWHTMLLGCAASGTCGDLGATVSLGGSVAGHDLVILSLAAPVLFGMLVGAPLLAHEFEAGTTEFAWAQSVTRSRWLLVKAGWTLLAAAVWGGVIAALVTWWSGPRNALLQNAFQPSTFDLQGLVPVGYAVFAAALGIAAGALLRRTVPAIAVTLGGFIGVRLLIADAVRPHYLGTVTAYFSPKLDTFTPPGSAWLITQGLVGKNGQVLSGSASTPMINGVPISSLSASCQSLVSARPGLRAVARGHVAGLSHAVLSCLQSSGVRGFATYQPASHYWPFQGIETGIYAALALALLAVAYVVATRRDA
jgi:hypothetical protein